MDSKDFSELVHRFEKFSQKSPTLYRLGLLLFALLGYFYLFALIICALAVFFIQLILYIKMDLLTFDTIISHLTHHRIKGLLSVVGFLIFLFFPLYFVWILIKSLWVRISLEEVSSVPEDKGKQIFAMLEELRDKFRGPEINSIHLNDQFGASMMQISKFGLFGKTKYHLYLGAPLLLVLTPEEFRAVIAHEYGHAIGAHGKFSSWIYRIRRSWGTLQEKVEQDADWGLKFFKHFLNWYAPRFDAYSFVLARQQEFEADRISAEFAGADIAAKALTATVVHSDLLSKKYWPQIYKRWNDHPEPDVLPFSDMFNALNSINNSEKIDRIQKAMIVRTTEVDTHPSLKDRLSALGHDPVIESKRDINALQKYFEDFGIQYVQTLDQNWKTEVAENWKKNYEESQVEKSKYLKLSAEKKLDEAQEFELAYLVRKFRDENEALLIYENLIERFPKNPNGYFHKGELLIEQNPELAIFNLEKSSELDYQYEGAVSEAIWRYYAEIGDSDSAEKYSERWQKFENLASLARKEREAVLFEDEFIPHDLKEKNINDLILQLKIYPELKEAYVFRKKLTYFPENPLYILGIITHEPILDSKAREEETQKIAKNLTVEEEMIIILLDQGNHSLFDTAIKIKDSKILSHSSNSKNVIG